MKKYLNVLVVLVLKMRFPRSRLPVWKVQANPHSWKLSFKFQSVIPPFVRLAFLLVIISLERATVAPTLIRLRKNTNLPANVDYRCSMYHPKIQSLVESKKLVLKDFPIHEVSAKMETVMTYIKETMFFSFEPVELVIECSLPHTRSISFIDLPGNYLC